jgi:hypothetical protein
LNLRKLIRERRNSLIYHPSLARWKCATAW